MPAHAKGSMFVHWREYVHERYGGPMWLSVLDELSAEDRQILENRTLIASTWYPLGVWNRGIDAFLRKVEPPDAVMRDLAAYVADRDLNTLFKVVLKMGTAEFLMRRTRSIWSRYIDVGTLRPEQRSPREWHMTLEAPVHEDEGPARHTCGAGVCAWLEQGLRATGVSGHVRHPACRLDGNPVCRYHVTW